jgi:hypothetical protein
VDADVPVDLLLQLVRLTGRDDCLAGHVVVAEGEDQGVSAGGKRLESELALGIGDLCRLELVDEDNHGADAFAVLGHLALYASLPVLGEHEVHAAHQHEQSQPRPSAEARQ